MTSKKIMFNGSIKKIYHLADVHIRNLKRHEEYKEVFNRLYNYIKDTKTDESVIVLVGDIVHAKTDMSPEVVNMTQNFLKSLSDELPTILIPGNHDANLNNSSRLDALSPIVNALNHPNLHYLRESGAWDMGNLTFIHTSVFSKTKKIISADSINGNFKVGLYHGAVDKVKTEYGFSINNKNVNVDSFKGYDLVLLGDIHVPNQSLNDSGTIKYCGSTIMQNHAESKHIEHGMLVWDVNTKKSEFVPLHNDYGYVTLEIDNGKILGTPHIPNKPRIRARVKDTSHSDLNKILSEIGIHKSIKELSVQKIITNQKHNDVSNTIGLQNVRDIGFQNKLIEQYLLDKYALKKSQLEIVKNINNDINKKIVDTFNLKSVVWKPKCFKFSNMFSYGKDNFIDFTNMKGTFGIFAPNTSGKSSLWDALSFCLFDKCSRTSKAINVLNNSKCSFNCTFNYEIDGVDYFIKRVASKSPKRGTVKVDVDFYREKDGVKEFLNGEDRRATNAIIRQHLGSYDDFVLTAMSVQNNNSGFIEKSQKERKELLAKFLDVDVFEQLYQVANNEIKELSTLLKEYKKENFTEKVSFLNNELNQHNKALDVALSKVENLNKSRNKIQDKVEKFINSLITLDGNFGDIEILKEKKLSIDKKISDFKNLKIEYDKKLKSYNQFHSEQTKKYNAYDLDTLKKREKKYVELKSKKFKIQNNLQIVKESINHNTKHLDGIGSLSFDSECKHCIANKNTPFAKQSATLKSEIDNLKKQLQEFELQICKLDSEMLVHDVSDEYEILKKLKQSIYETSDSIKEYQYKTENIDLKIKTLSSELSKLNESIKNTNKQKEAIQHNLKTQSVIDNYKSKCKIFDDEISDLNSIIIEISGDIKIIENDLKKTNDSIIRLEQMEKKYLGYEHYLKCVRRDGIPYKLISDILPKLEIEINNILSPIVDFRILLNTDGKNINSFIAYKDDNYWPLELTSGMEKFISSIAIRTALVNISNLPRPNFMAIDEGFGSLDSANFNSLYLLFSYLKTQFDFIITISHIDKTRDMVDNIIDISKIDGFSSIQYL